MPAKPCLWRADEDGNWFTDCGHAFVLTEGTPRENGFEFCCYCGKPLQPDRVSPVRSWELDEYGQGLQEERRQRKESGS